MHDIVRHSGETRSRLNSRIANNECNRTQLGQRRDCFRCLPNYGNDLRKQYNRQLFEIARSDLLSSLFTQLLGRKAEIGKMDPDMYKEIPFAEYALS